MYLHDDLFVCNVLKYNNIKINKQAFIRKVVKPSFIVAFLIGFFQNKMIFVGEPLGLRIEGSSFLSSCLILASSCE